MPALQSGQLIGWLGNDENAATTWTAIETHWFVHGMSVHRSGRLTKGRAPVKQYEALRKAPGGSVWFVTDHLRGLGLVPSPSRATLQTRLKEWKRRDHQWIQGSDLAHHFAHQRGPITTSERQALYNEACQQIFRSLLHGDFTDEHKLPHVRPHRLKDAGFRRMTPELAERFWEAHSGGRRDHDGEPALSNDLLHELTRSVWLPIRCVVAWCHNRNMRFPRGHGGQATAPPTALDYIVDWIPTRQPHSDATATRVTRPTNEGQRLWSREDFTKQSTLHENLVSWARLTFGLLDNRDDQWVPSPAKLLKDHRAEFPNIKGINEKTMRPVRHALTTEKQRRGGAPAHRKYK